MARNLSVQTPVLVTAYQGRVRLDLGIDVLTGSGPPLNRSTSRVTRAHYNAGDYIFRQGEPGNNFYIIEKGEVEVLRTKNEKNEAELLAVLKEGEFFGEMALLDSQARVASVRARTPVQVVVMGRNVFTQLSRSMTPLRNILIDTVKHRDAAL